MKWRLLISAAGVVGNLFAADVPTLRSDVRVGGDGVYLDELLEGASAVLPHVRISQAPRFGQVLSIPRGQINSSLTRLTDGAITNCLGAETVRVARKSRLLEEEEMVSAVTSRLQQDQLKDRAELELRTTRPWISAPVPDEPLSIRIVELPASGLSSIFLCRFEVATTNNEVVGSWQATFSAKAWRQVWIPSTALRRGMSVSDAPLSLERRDILNLREPLAEFSAADSSLEIADFVPASTPLLARHIKIRPSVRRGQRVEAVITDGALAITLKVEALEDGIEGQTIRIRNPQSKRDLVGRVKNENTVIVSL